MAQDIAQYLWLAGNIVPVEEANISDLTPTVFWGTNIFEGVRAYWNSNQGQMFCFRLEEHLKRLAESAKMMRMSLPFDPQEYGHYIKEILVANELRQDVHIDVRIYLDGIGRWFDKGPTNLLITPFPIGRLMDVERGVHCNISSWRRISDDTMPARIKAGSNYQNSRLAILEAEADGYQATLMLNKEGKVSEGPAYCVFAVRGGKVITPPVACGILESITRETLIELFRKEMGLSVEEREVDRTELYVAQEVFICATRIEIVPIISIDRIEVGTGKPGPITQEIQKRYFNIVRGADPSYERWLTQVY